MEEGMDGWMDVFCSVIIHFIFSYYNEEFSLVFIKHVTSLMHFSTLVHSSIICTHVQHNIMSEFYYMELFITMIIGTH